MSFDWIITSNAQAKHDEQVAKQVNVGLNWYGLICLALLMTHFAMGVI